MIEWPTPQEANKWMKNGENDRAVEEMNSEDVESEIKIKGSNEKNKSSERYALAISWYNFVISCSHLIQYTRVGFKMLYFWMDAEQCDITINIQSFFTNTLGQCIVGNISIMPQAIILTMLNNNAILYYALISHYFTIHLVWFSFDLVIISSPLKSLEIKHDKELERLCRNVVSSAEMHKWWWYTITLTLHPIPTTCWSPIYSIKWRGRTGGFHLEWSYVRLTTGTETTPMSKVAQVLGVHPITHKPNFARLPYLQRPGLRPSDPSTRI